MSLTIQFVPYSSVENMSSILRLKKLLKIVKENKIVLLEGRLRKEEEAELIKITMQEIDSHFRGIELQVIYPTQDEGIAFFKRIKDNIINKLLGNRKGFTIIGPASIIKEIRKDPNKVLLFTQDNKKSKKR